MKRSVDIEMPELRPKKTREIPGQPVPVPLSSITGQPASNFVWKRYTGILRTEQPEDVNGRTAFVEIQDISEIDSLWNNGYFGYTSTAREDEVREYEVQPWNPGTDFFQIEQIETWEEDTEFWATNRHKKEDELKSDENTEQEHKRDTGECEENVTQEPRSWKEAGNWFGLDESGLHESQTRLRLELCEAFYLSYTLGCLVVEENSKALNLLGMWRRYLSLENDFPYRYAVYHHLRSNGWVVRSGHVFASDWTVYRLGPPFYHSSFTVRIEVVCGQSGKLVNTGNVTPLTWADLLGLNRLNENVKKDLLVARVEKHGVQEADLTSPHLLRKLAIKLRSVKRWQPGEMRWEIKPEVPVESRK